MAVNRGELITSLRRRRRAWRDRRRGHPRAAPQQAGSTPAAAARPASSWPATFERNAPYSPTPDNRPAPLACGPLALTRDTRTQMSFGERAALAGVLAEVRPRVAIEIGTAQGGNLRRMARTCAHVYSIDLDHGPVGDDLPGNVELLTGDSATVLPRLLGSLAGRDQPVDLVLVDGDHSYEGVRSDVRHLLSSPCTARTAILVHDTMNPEVRAGLESLALDEYPAIVYVELDFVTGYVYRKGVAREMAWGGLGLVLTDRERCGAYVQSPRQDLYHDPFFAIQSLRGDTGR